jgi:hypothetical protein
MLTRRDTSATDADITFQLKDALAKSQSLFAIREGWHFGLRLITEIEKMRVVDALFSRSRPWISIYPVQLLFKGASSIRAKFLALCKSVSHLAVFSF